MLFRSGRTGTLTPVAILEPVNIGGVMVSRASLHNQDEIQNKDIRINDTVIVKRAGDVIPQVIKPVKSKRTGQEIVFAMPTHCPVCGSIVRRFGNEAAVKCINASCKAQLKQRLTHFVSKGGFDMDGLGKKLIEQLVDRGLVASFADLFTLDRPTLAAMDRMGEKSAANIVKAIEDSKSIPLRRFLFALGMDHTGESAALVLSNTFLTLDALVKAIGEELSAVEGIGPKTAESIVAFFANQENRATIDRMMENGVVVEDQGPVKQEDGPGASFFNEKRVVLTGTLSTMTRSVAKQRLEQQGARVGSSVTKNTDILVAGESSGSKLAKAVSLGVTVMDEQTFLEHIEVG